MNCQRATAAPVASLITARRPNGSSEGLASETGATAQRKQAMEMNKIRSALCKTASYTLIIDNNVKRNQRQLRSCPRKVKTIQRKPTVALAFKLSRSNAPICVAPAASAFVTASSTFATTMYDSLQRESTQQNQNQLLKWAGWSQAQQ